MRTSLADRYRAHASPPGSTRAHSRVHAASLRAAVARQTADHSSAQHRPRQRDHRQAGADPEGHGLGASARGGSATSRPSRSSHTVTAEPAGSAGGTPSSTICTMPSAAVQLTGRGAAAPERAGRPPGRAARRRAAPPAPGSRRRAAAAEGGAVRGEADEHGAEHREQAQATPAARRRGPRAVGRRRPGREPPCTAARAGSATDMHPESRPERAALPPTPVLSLGRARCRPGRRSSASRRRGRRRPARGRRRRGASRKTSWSPSTSTTSAAGQRPGQAQLPARRDHPVVPGDEHGRGDVDAARSSGAS